MVATNIAGRVAGRVIRRGVKLFGFFLVFRGRLRDRGGYIAEWRLSPTTHARLVAQGQTVIE